MTSLPDTVVALAPLGLAQAGGLDSSATSWVLGLAGAAVIFNQIYSAWSRLMDSRAERPDPTATYARLDMCTEHHRGVSQSFRDVSVDMVALERRIEKLEVWMKDIEKTMHDRVAGAHKRMDGLLEKVSHLSGELEGRGDG